MTIPNIKIIKTIKKFTLHIALIFSLAFSISILKAQPIIQLHQLNKYQNLDSIAEVFIDTTNEISFDKIQHQAFKQKSIPFAPSVKYTYWLRFKVQDTLHYDVNYRFNMPLANYVSIYYPTKKGNYKSIKSGIFDKQQPSKQFYSPLQPIVEFNELDTSKYFYVFIKNFSYKGKMNKLSQVWVQAILPDTPNTSQNKNELLWDLFYKIFLGLLLGLFIYFFLTYFFNHWLPFLLYSLYLLSLFIYFLNRINVIEHLWRETYPLMQMIVNDCSMMLSSILYTAFVAAYLNVRKNYPKLFPFIVFYITILTMGMFWYSGVLLMDRYNPIHIGFIDYEFVFVTIFSIGMLIYIVWKGVKGTGWVVIVGSIILIIGNALAMIGGNFTFITPFVTVEVMLFALGLGYQIRLNDMERLKTREELIEQMQITEQLQLNFQSRLEKEVELQTKKADAMSRAAAIAREEQIHTELLTELEQAKMKALQTQMNPHFIFNCINSIRLFYMKNDLEKADSYITKFSKLIRSILNFSRQENITLKEELNTLALYMEFEQMRFDSKFDYVIQVADELTPAKIRIPSLLLQPFIENAIWHGLMQSDKHGIVRIDVQPLLNNQILITIEDNGIGRVKAKEYSQQNLSKHKSFGLRITKERLDLLKRSQNKTATFEVIDLYDDKRQPRGTKVQIIYDL